MKKTIQVNYQDWKILKEKCAKAETQINKYLAELISGRYYVYKLKMEDESIYIGQTINLKTRIHNHLNCKDVKEMEIVAECENRIDAINIERKFIIENPNCINKNYYNFDFEVSEMARMHSEIMQQIYCQKFNHVLYVSGNGYINNSNLEKMIYGCNKSGIDKDFIDILAKTENIPKEKIIITKEEKWIHPTIALDVFRSSSVENKIKVYELLFPLSDIIREKNNLLDISIKKANENR